MLLLNVSALDSHWMRSSGFLDISHDGTGLAGRSMRADRAKNRETFIQSIAMIPV
jgi:hypothetical protein